MSANPFNSGTSKAGISIENIPGTSQYIVKIDGREHYFLSQLDADNFASRIAGKQS